MGQSKTIKFDDDGYQIDKSLIFNVAGKGLPYACIDGMDETVETDENNWVQITFDTVFLENLMVGNVTENHITVEKTGVYKVSVTICGHTAVAHDFEFMVKINNGIADKRPHLFQSTSVAGQVENVAGSCIISLTKADTVELWILCSDADAIDFIFDHVNLNLVMIGG